MTETNLKKWYVVRVVSGQENKVKAYIETEINRLGMADYISQVLVPTEKVVQVRDGKKITKDKVYFPGYVMIEANLAGEIPHIIKSITSVIGFLGETKRWRPCAFENVRSK
jgi:transcriptional antiterminator NusG